MSPHYGVSHRTLRRRWQRQVEQGLVVCARCGMPIQPDEAWHLDHDDGGTGYLGPSHARCNVRAGAIKTNKERAAALRASRSPADGRAWPTNKAWTWSRCWCCKPDPCSKHCPNYAHAA